MADTVKFNMLRKLLRALGLSETAVNDLFNWITDRLADEQQQSAATVAAPSFPYRVRDDFLSPAEHSFYQVLKTVADTRVLICPKVSLADLFYVKSKDASEWRIYTNKIDRKHVDFVLCDPQTMTPLAGIELDDKSHERTDRKQRDGFVEGVFAAAGMPLLRVRVQHGYQSRELAALLENVLPSIADEVVSSPTQEYTSEPSPVNARADDIRESVDISAPTCPKCGSKMLLRTSKKGNIHGQQFWGCSNFPRCRAIIDHVMVAM